MRTEIKRDEHVFISGATGTGKTELAKAYLARYKNVVVLDSKRTFDWSSYVPKDKIKIVNRISDLSGMTDDKIIWRVDYEEDSQEHFNEFFKWCFFRKNTIVMVDEAMAISPNPHKIPKYYKAILTQGRELGVSVWSCTQRPSGIANVIMTESTHYFIFRLNAFSDRQKIKNITGEDKFLTPMQGHKFLYWRPELLNPVMAELKINKKRR